MKRIAVLLLPAAALFCAVAVAPLEARAQQARDRVFQEEDALKKDEGEAAWILERPLPFRNGQRLKYYDPDGSFIGYAERRQLKILFYDDRGFYVGKAERVSQAVTRYYAADGTYIGRRLHKKMTTAAANHSYERGGFVDPTTAPTNVPQP